MSTPRNRSSNTGHRGENGSNGNEPGGEKADDWAAIGDIVGVFGVRGELKVAPLSDIPRRFARLETVYVGAQRTPFRVLGAHEHKRQVLLRLEGLADRTSAEELRGMRLWIPAAALTPLPRDQYYLHDVVGLRVQHINGQPLGTVADVLTTGANDLFVVHDTPTGAEVLLPVVKAFVKSIDLVSGIVLVDPIPGLFDEQAEEARD
jgi:16S rRNA processing protein RimM